MAGPRIVEYQQRTEATNIRDPYAGRNPGPEGAAQVGAILGNSLNRLERGVNDLGDAVINRENEQARAWSSTALAQARLDWTQKLLDSQANAEPGAPDFTKNLTTDFDQYASKAIEAAPNRTSQRFLGERLNELRTHIGENALQFEAKARIDYRNDQFTNAIRTTQQLMATDPSQYKVALAEQLSIIDASAMPPVQKSALRQKAIDDVSLSAVWSQIQKSPTAFLENIGFLNTTDPRTGKVRKSSGDLTGATGNEAFDALPFERRVQMFNEAIKQKAQVDMDVDRLASKEQKRLSDDATKELWSLDADHKLTRNEIEKRRPLLSPAEYRSALNMLPGNGGETQKSDPASFRLLQKTMIEDPTAAVKLAFTLHSNGLLSNQDLQTNVNHARTLDRQEGPKSQYERSRQYITLSLDPGPLIPDPIGKSRFASAINDFDSWVASGKRTDQEVDERGKELVRQYKFVNLSDTIAALPLPRGGNMSRNVTDLPKMNAELIAAGKNAQQKLDSGQWSQADYNQEVAILNQWRKTIATGGKK